MSPRPVRVVVVGSTLGPRRLGPEVRWVLRPDPAEALDFVRRVRPSLVLLGEASWEAGWAPLLRSASPGTVVLREAA